MSSDGQLAQEYARERSESAFGELVARHVDLVYGAALRLVNGDRHLAQDVTQLVFIHLARKAGELRDDVLLPGWLHRHTCYTAATLVRTERRRRAREQRAMELGNLDQDPEPSWAAVAPHLDKTLDELGAADRDALVLRFLQGRSLRDVGAALGISEDTAQKRVSRAVEKLRGALSRRGVALSSAGLASILTAKAVTAAPAGLAAGVTAASLTAATQNATASLSLNIMAAKLKVVLVGGAVLACVVAPVIVEVKARSKLRHQTALLAQQAHQLSRLQAQNQDLSESIARVPAAADAGAEQFNQLLKLRGEIAPLRAAVQSLAQSPTNGPLSRDQVLASMRQMYGDRLARLKQMFAANPGEAVPELQYLSDDQWLEQVQYDRQLNETNGNRALSSTRNRAQIQFALSVLSDALWRYGKQNPGAFPTDLSQLAPYFKSPVDPAMLQEWAILPTSSMPTHLRVSGDWVITEKAPVDAELDERVVVGIKESRLGRHRRLSAA
jgi:RNA polymerase sigma factor (sigma-70 family)